MAERDGRKTIQFAGHRGGGQAVSCRGGYGRRANQDFRHPPQAQFIADRHDPAAHSPDRGGNRRAAFSGQGSHVACGDHQGRTCRRRPPGRQAPSDARAFAGARARTGGDRRTDQRHDVPDIASGAVHRRITGDDPQLESDDQGEIAQSLRRHSSSDPAVG